MVSVGPYMFQTDPARSSSSPASRPGNASPPQITLRSGLPCQPAVDSICQVAGVACITVVPDARISAISRSASATSSSSASTSRAFRIRGR